jgi:uncharacterized protein YjbJ (UPF0337 family)
MNKDEVIGTARNIGGKAQEAFGHVTGDAKSQVEGAINRAAGAAQDLYGQAKEAASDASQAIRHGAVDAEDYIRHTIEKRPYTTALVAFCVGLLIGRIGRRDW